MFRLIGRIALVVVLASCAGACTRVNPGYVGIKVSMAGSDKGVQDIPARTGWVFYNPFSSSVYEYPTFVQTAVWTKNPNEGKEANEEITFTTGDQMQVSADISIGYNIKPERVPAFYVTFRNDDIDRFTHGYMRNLARDKFDSVAGKYKIEQIMGDNAEFMTEVRKELQAALEPVGIQIMQFGFIGAPRPPQQVIDSINAKVQATQLTIQKQNEVATETAEANKKIEQSRGQAESLLRVAKAQAEANRILTESLTPSLLELKRIEKWDGVQPQMITNGTPFISVTKDK